MTVSGAISTVSKRYGVEMEKSYFSDECRHQEAGSKMFALIDAVGRAIAASQQLAELRGEKDDFTVYDYLMKALENALEPAIRVELPKGKKGKKK